MSINLKSIVSKQIPEFAREDYPLFVQFVEAYYEYLAQTENRNLTELRDIDQTVDSFVQYFKNELDIYGNKYEFIDQKLFLRKVKELHSSGGTEAAYKFLFRLLYNKTADITYPWNSVLKASDGRWQQEMSIFLETTSGDPTTLPGNRIAIIGTNIRIGVFVTRVKYIRDNIYEIFIDKNYYGEILHDYTIDYNGITGKILRTTSGYEVVAPGVGYKVGDIFETTTVSNAIKITQLIKVTKVDSNGGIVNITTVRFGAGYESEFYVLRSNATISSASEITITKGTTLQYTLPDETNIEQYTDLGYILNPDYYDLNYGESTYAGDLLRTFYEESLSGQGLNPDYALIRFKVGAVAKYQGHYNTNDGFLSDDIYLQDSYKWQKFSYLIIVDEKLEKYKDLIKSYLHPAGTMLFGEYQIQNTYAPSIAGSIEVSQWRSAATFSTINKSISNDYAYPSDEGGKIRIEPYDENYSDTADYYNPPLVYTFYGDGRNNLEDSMTVTDTSPNITGP